MPPGTAKVRSKPFASQSDSGAQLPTHLYGRIDFIGGVRPFTTRSTENKSSSLIARGGEPAGGPMLFLNLLGMEHNLVP